MGARIIRIQGQSLSPGRHCVGIVLLLRKCHREIKQLVEVGRRSLDPLQPLSGNIDELRDIHCAVSGRSIFDQNRRAVVAILVDVSQVHLGVIRRSFGGEHQPMPIRRKTMP